MTHLHITLNLDINPWSDLGLPDTGTSDPETFTFANGVRIGLLPHGTAAGRPVVMMHGVSDAGKNVIVQVTWRQLEMAVSAFKGSPVVALSEP